MITGWCSDFLCRLLRDKETRLSCKKYQIQDQTAVHPAIKLHMNGRHVYPDDANEIKSHGWFQGIPWHNMLSLRPPFQPRIDGPDDTRYFESTDPVCDWSDSTTPGSPDAVDVFAVLSDYRPLVQEMGLQLISKPHSSSSMRKIEERIDCNSQLSSHEKDILKHFIRVYGKKPRKRARDLLLRDADTKDAVMEMRKSNAFLGYTWHRIRPREYHSAQWIRLG